MANYAQLKAAVDQYIKTNGNNEITGAVLNDVLNTIITSLGTNYQFAGVATPSTNPQTPDQNVVYFASEAGTYTNFNGIVLPAGISLLMWNGSWSAQTFFTVDDEPTAGSNNFVKSGGVFEKDSELEVNMSELNILSYYESLSGYRISSNGSTETDFTYAYVVAHSSYSLLKYNVTAGKKYAVDYHVFGRYGFFCIWWRDNNGFIKRNCYVKYADIDVATDYTNYEVIAPEGAVEMWMQVVNGQNNHSFKEVVRMIPSQQLLDEISQVKEDLEIASSYIRKLSVLDTTSIAEGYRISSNGSTETDYTYAYVVAASSFSLLKYNVTAGNMYAVDYHVVGNYGYWAIWWRDNNGFIKRQCITNTSGSTDYNNYVLKAPEGAVEMWMQVVNGQNNHSFKEVNDEMISSESLDERITVIEEKENRTMKVVVNALEGEFETTPFYIRTRYNDEKDIIITHRVNSNSLITFHSTYIGSNELLDIEIMTSENLVSVHTDSTGPLRSSETYWHLFAQHGYVIPTINNTVSMTDNSVGSEWKDQLERHYIIGKVTSSKIYLLPKIYQSGGHYTRDWKAPTGTAITSLSYVSGSGITTSITVSGYSNTQLFPIAKHSNRKWYADNMEIKQSGTYYCDDFKVSESQVGYDPATITTLFDSDGKVDLTGASPMAEFTYSFNYKGAQCCVNSTISILRDVNFGYYGGTQQQFFYDNGSYKAMFMLPKVTPQNGVDVQKPFNSPSSQSPSFDITNDVVDLNNPPERIIGFLHNPNDGTYRIGMAAGLSLISGDTIPTKRRIGCPVGSILLSFSPSNNNKFYVNAFNNTPYSEQGGYYPTTFFKEVNYYVSYFDPAENTGQVYWYKDGSKYVIYCHCQSVQSRLAINLPEFMEGLKLSIVEKTTNTELLTDIVTNGKFFVNYNTTDANYIVLKAE